MQASPDRPNEFYFAAWRRTFDFEGVASRTEFWSFWLITLALPLVIWLFWWPIPLAVILLGVATVILPILSVLVRRVRDATGSGWFILMLIAFSVNPLFPIAVLLSPSRDVKRLDRLPGMYWDVWRKVADFLGVAKRGEFWPFTLKNVLVLVVWALIPFAVYYYTISDNTSWWFCPYFSWSDDRCRPLTILFVTLLLIPVSAVVLFTPWISLVIRRVRDATGTGWVALIGLIPFFGIPQLLLLVICLFPSRERSDPANSGHQTAGESPGTGQPTQYEEDPWAGAQSNNERR